MAIFILLDFLRLVLFRYSQLSQSKVPIWVLLDCLFFHCLTLYFENGLDGVQLWKVVVFSLLFKDNLKLLNNLWSVHGNKQCIVLTIVKSGARMNVPFIPRWLHGVCTLVTGQLLLWSFQKPINLICRLRYLNV